MCGVFQPLGVLAPQIVLSKSLNLLEELCAVLIEAARELMDLVGHSHRHTKDEGALLCLKALATLQIGHFGKCTAQDSVLCSLTECTHPNPNMHFAIDKEVQMTQLDS